jgi:hypothetical protein
MYSVCEYGNRKAQLCQPVAAEDSGLVVLQDTTSQEASPSWLDLAAYKYSFLVRSKARTRGRRSRQMSEPAHRSVSSRRYARHSRSISEARSNARVRCVCRRAVQQARKVYSAGISRKKSACSIISREVLCSLLSSRMSV